MNRFLRRVALGVVLSCGAFAAQAQVVVSQVWGSAGSTGAAFDRDYVELFNRGSAPVSLSGLSVQYASATGTGNFAVASTLPAVSIQPGQRFLVGLATGTGTAALPAPDATGTTNISGGAGKVALVNSATALACNGGSTPCSPAQAALIVDLVGYGTANYFEGSAAAPAPSAANAVLRNAGGCSDTNNNGADFAAAPAAPRNASASATPCAGAGPVISIDDQSAQERDAMTQATAISVRLSQPAGPGGVSFDYAFTAGTATAGVDYVASNGSATIAEGQTVGSFSIGVTGDTSAEPNETVNIAISNILGATAGDVAAVFTILDDDAPPALSFGDQTAVEGDSGTKQFMFSVTLSRPAGPGGLTFQFDTADDTANAGSDYVAVVGGSGTIAEGQTSTVVSVVVNGDTTVEPNETFFINIANAGGAVVADGQGVGTINNDDVVVTPIHDIQGNGNTSPLVGQSVTTRGIVTGRRSNGFFLQTPDADADADPATSQGVFVFTGTAPSADAQIGNTLIVSGTVIEFVPAADPGQLSLTEITGPTLTLVSTMNPLPTPVQLTTTFPDPSGPLDQLERAEAMRVTAASFTVVAATGGNTSEPNATGSSNGQINLVVTGTARPFREPGIQAPDPAPGGGSIPPIPRWDFNPELLFSDTDAMGGPRHDLAVGATLQNYVGPLDYGFRRFSVHQDPTVAPTITAGPAPSAARVPTAGEFTYASYNLERFFDTVADGNGAPTLTATAFNNRLAKASLGIRNFLHTPDILGVVEVENLSTLQALAARINADAVAASQPDPRYVAHLLEGNDVGGIDVGYLVKTAEVAPGRPRVEVVGSVVQLGANATWNDPVNGPGTLLNDRPPLLLDAVVNFADGRAFPITTIQVHQRSLNGADTNDAAGDRTRTKRHLQAVFLAEQIDDMQIADPQRRIAVGGDFNAFEFNDGLTDAMGTVTGLPSPDDRTAVSGDGIDYVVTDLLNLFVEEPADQRYSFEFDGNAQSLDHVLVNQALGATAGAVGLDHARINADFPEILRGNTGTVARLADHDPVMAYVDVASADLAVSASATPAATLVGSPMTFSVTVTNNGPDTASFPGMGFAFNALLPDLSVQAPAGWSCDPPAQDGGNTVVACAAPSLASAASAVFTLTASAPASRAGASVTMVSSTDAATFDPAGTNNSTSASVAVRNGGLSVTIAGPATAPSTLSFVDHEIRVRNDGLQSAANAQIVIDNFPAANAAYVIAPADWRCTARRLADRTSTTCVTASIAANATVVFTTRTKARPVPANRTLTVSAAVTSGLANDDPSDNSASFSTTIL